MSATGRNKPDRKRNEKDQYQTPLWCTQALLSNRAIPFDLFKTILEPCAGGGKIIQACELEGLSSKFHAIELDEKYQESLKVLSNTFVECPQDFLTYDFGDKRYDCVLTNPPYSKSMEFVKKALTLSDHVIMLLSLGYHGCISRYDFMKATTPDTMVLTPRPRFVHGGSDQTEYAWFYWHKNSAGRLTYLPIGPHKKVRTEVCLKGTLYDR